MEKQVLSRSQTHLQALSISVGHFIRYWGFRRIHGAVWTQLYLSQTPLSGAELTKRLLLSKALISPALTELEEYQLIKPIKSENEKTKLYIANDDVENVIKHILRIREKKMLEAVAKNLKNVQKTDSANTDLNTMRLAKLTQMVESAQFMLELILNSGDLMNFPQQLPVESEN